MFTTFNCKMVTEPKVTDVNGTTKTTVRVKYNRRYVVEGKYHVEPEYVTLVAFGKVAEMLMMFSWKDHLTVAGTPQWKEWKNGKGLFINLTNEIGDDGWPLGVSSRETHEERWMKNTNKDGISAWVSLTAVKDAGEPDKYGRVQRVMFWWEKTSRLNAETGEWEEEWNKQYVLITSTKGTAKKLAAVKNGYRMLAKLRVYEYGGKKRAEKKLGAQLLGVKKVEEVKGQY